MRQMYTNDVDFTKFYPMKSKGEAADTLISFMQDIGIPSDLHSDDAKELAGGAWVKCYANFGLNCLRVNHILHGKSELNFA
jgi:hypothetical protein